MSDPVLHPVMLLCLLGIVPTIDGAHQIAGDATDALELLRHQGLVERHIAIPCSGDAELAQTVIGMLLHIVDVTQDLLLGHILQTFHSHINAVDYHSFVTFSFRIYFDLAYLFL